MTLRAVAGKPGEEMARFGGGIIIRCVAAIAVSGQSGELIIGMAAIAVDGGVPAG